MRFIISVLAIQSLFGVASPAYSTKTVKLYNHLGTCVSKTASDISCMTEVKDGLVKIQTTIQDVRDLKTSLTKIVSGINTLNTVLTIAKYAPGIGGAVNVLKNAITVIKTPLVNAKNKVTTIDNKIYPWKAKLDKPIANLTEAIKYEGFINGNCTNGQSFVGGAKNCVDDMSSGIVRTASQNGLEAFGGALNSDLSVLNLAFGNIGTICSTVKKVTDVALAWPSLGSLKNALNKFTSAIDPILNFFSSFQKVLDKKFCIPNPFEEIRELEIVEEAAEAFRAAARKAAEKGKEAAETAKEVAKSVSRIRIRFRRWGKRRRGASYDQSAQLQQFLKKSLEDITITEDLANRIILSERAAEACFSVQQIIDGLNAAFDALLKFANDAINAALSALPSFSLPGLPNFNILNFNFNFNLPSLEFGFDFTLYAKFDYLRFDCANRILSICQAASGDLNVNCGLSLSSYQATYGKRQLEYLETRETSDSDNSAVIVHLDGNTEHNRTDDKTISLSEAQKCVKNMSPEGKKKLAQRLKKLGLILTANGDVQTTTTDLPSITTSASQPIAEEDRRANIVRFLEDLQG